MTESKSKKLNSLPWQALYDTAIAYKIDPTEINKKEKQTIISKLILILSEEEIDNLVSDYIYGDRIAFTLWGFNQVLEESHYEIFQSLEGHIEFSLNSRYFRNLKILSVENRGDRLEILYVYSKEYSYLDEEGHNESIWEQHRGCIWIGISSQYLACISKHDKMTTCITSFISEKTQIGLTQLKPPKAAIERCINYKAISKIVLQGSNGEKTTISRSEGLTNDQEEELARIREQRFDTSGSYIAEITNDTSATVKYNMKKGNIGIHKHLPAPVLFDWSNNAINIILEEIDNLKGKPIESIYKELGLELKWTGLSEMECTAMNWFLSTILSALDSPDEYTVTLEKNTEILLNRSNLFKKIPRVYCNKCDSYEVPHCQNCGEALTSDKNGNISCHCESPLTIVCPEGHYCQTEYWYLPQKKFTDMISQKIHNVFKNLDTQYQMCIMGNQLHILPTKNEAENRIEIPFDDIDCFKDSDSEPNPQIKDFAIRLKEKCNNTCSSKQIEKCITDSTMICLPKIFYTVLPNFRPQPHKGTEYGDISSEIIIKNRSYEMKGIIKKNSKNTGRGNYTNEDLIATHLLSTSSEGEEIIRQFVEQGMIDNRCQIIAIAAPQYFDAGLKGTLRYLARIANKKIVFIELDEICKVIKKNKAICIS